RRERLVTRPARDRLERKHSAYPVPQGREQFRRGQGGRIRRRGATRGRRRLRGDQVRRRSTKSGRRLLSGFAAQTSRSRPRNKRYRRTPGGRPYARLEFARIYDRIGLRRAQVERTNF